MRGRISVEKGFEFIRGSVTKVRTRGLMVIEVGATTSRKRRVR